MVKSLIKDWALLPGFALPSRDGVIFDVSEFRRTHNLVLFLVAHPDSDFLISLEEMMPQARFHHAQVVVISTLPIFEIEQLHRRHRFSFWILSDVVKEVFGKFMTSEPQGRGCAVFIVKSSGEVFFQSVAESCSHLPPFADILQSLAFVAGQRVV